MDNKSLIFNRLYSSYHQKALIFARSYLHDEFAAEDITAEALMKVWEVMKEEEINDLVPFFFVVLKNKLLDHLRRNALKQKMIDSMSTIDKRDLEIRIASLEECNPDHIFFSEIQQIVSKTLASLPEKTRDVFRLSRAENYSNKVIAEKLGMTVKGVEYHMSRAIKLLRLNLKDYLPFFPILYLLN